MTCKTDQTGISKTVRADRLDSWLKTTKEYSELILNEKKGKKVIGGWRIHSSEF